MTWPILSEQDCQGRYLQYPPPIDNDTKYRHTPPYKVMYQKELRYLNSNSSLSKPRHTCFDACNAESPIPHCPVCDAQ